MRIDNLSHAIIFSAEEGSGSLPQALLLAKYILCTNKTKENKACGVCAACRKTRSYVHPDWHFIVPVNRSAHIAHSRNPVTDDFLNLWREALLENERMTEQQWYQKIDLENKQGAISVAEASNLLNKLQYKPFEGGSRVILIWLPERMHPTAANKLLKTLEEPSAGTYFLLVSHRPDQLLPTIRSRCLYVQVSPEEQVPPPREVRTQLESLLDLCLSGKPSGVLEWAEDMGGLKREEQKNFVHYVLHILRQYYMLTLRLPSLARLDASVQEKAQKYAARMSETFFINVTEQLNVTAERLERHVNAKVLFTSLAFDFFLSLQQ
ncbi:MAG: hypothetical protein WBK97_07695 [Bacteroidales bacterium]